jgi:hypothetical protein
MLSKAMKHPFWELASKKPKSDAERVAVAGVEALGNHPKFRSLHSQQIYDKLLEEAEMFLNLPPEEPKP